MILNEIADLVGLALVAIVVACVVYGALVWLILSLFRGLD